MTRPVVVAMGDSIAVGVGELEPGTPRAGFAAHVAHALDAREFVNVAANGARAASVAHEQLPRALMARPDVVLISVGGNDVLRGDFNPQHVRDHLAETVMRLDRPGRTIMVLGLTRIGLFDVFPEAVRRVMGARVDATNTALALACAGRAVFLPGARALSSAGASAFHIDRIHPSPRGHRAIATTALATLEPEWNQRRPIPEPAPMPHIGLQIAWLAVHGVPWVVKRSRDLLPHVTRVVAHELLEERRTRATVYTSQEVEPTTRRHHLPSPMD